MKRTLLFCALAFYGMACCAKIDRKALVQRNSPHITHIDTLASLSVGNGEFAFTCDVTGLQTFYQHYSQGVPLGTMSQWGWHSFPNTGGYKPQDVLRAYDFGRGHEEWYSCQLKDEHGKAAADYLRANPHRLHLGIVGFKGMEMDSISDIDQTLDMWNGQIISHFRYASLPIKVVTACHPERNMIEADINDPSLHSVQLLFPYPTGKHSDDACNWADDLPHNVQLVSINDHSAVYRHTLDSQSYYISIVWRNAEAPVIQHNSILIRPNKKAWNLTVEYTPELPSNKETNERKRTGLGKVASHARTYWNRYWKDGAAVDFSHCTNPLAKELERRVVLSQYLTAIQCAGSTPPQETGLTYNSWFGKFHLEMIWWHQAHFALWGHPEMMARTLPWYESAAIMAKQIAERQGFEGIRWMKMTDPSAAEAPSNVGSFLIWQQPHFIYLCELLYRATGNKDLLHRYAPLVQQTAEFMASFTTYDADNKRYILKGAIPAQETLKAAETINPPFELSYWHFALGIAQKWRERLGLSPNPQWNHIINSLSHLSAKQDVYAAAETAPSYPALKPFRKGDYDENGILAKTTTATRENKEGPFEASQLPEAIKLYSDHMAVLAACGVLPESPQYDMRIMQNTLLWVMQNWNWDKTWGWDYPTTCMTAVRTGMPEIAIEALLKDCRTNTYLPNGHNYQDSRLRCYLPGNGGLLTAVALMCAGYDGCNTTLPGFPKDGSWDVRYEGLLPMP